MAYNTEPNALRDEYDAFLAKIQRERAEGPALEEQSDDKGYDWMPDDDDGPDCMEWMQDYLEYVILLSNCAAVRSAKGLPPMPCARGAPCSECRQHDGSYVPIAFWHTIPHAVLELHMAEYLRIRGDLPAWKSSRPGYLAPANLQLSSLPPVSFISMEGLLRARSRYVTDLSIFVLDPVQAANAEAQRLSDDTGLMSPVSRHSLAGNSGTPGGDNIQTRLATAAAAAANTGANGATTRSAPAAAAAAARRLAAMASQSGNATAAAAATTTPTAATNGGAAASGPAAATSAAIPTNSVAFSIAEDDDDDLPDLLYIDKWASSSDAEASANDDDDAGSGSD
ncbi:hypothetical protein AURDEDRAFT_122396 [Auricularia subglabra TFB-10046 SS5]|nr:hypothetical protein AURDEDRAFT_122396 [Auricularia subglabra TFB-10046 SS5]